jgi:hypothetical protein
MDRRPRIGSGVMSWTTRLEPALSAQYRVAEFHSVWLVPIGWPGKGPAVTLLIPECELQLVKIGDDGEPLAFINRPQANKNVKHWLRYACGTAHEMGAALSLGCDSAEQAERGARLAGRLLPKHERIALERIYRGDTRCRSGLN